MKENANKIIKQAKELGFDAKLGNKGKSIYFKASCFDMEFSS